MEQPDLSYEASVLRDSLQEAEDMRRAISLGQVDAVVVGPTEEQKRVLLFSGAYARYRQLVEDMQQGAVTLSSSGEILFANHSFAAMVDEPLMDLFRTSLAGRLVEQDRPRISALASAGPGQADFEVRLLRKDGGVVPVSMSLVSTSDDFTTLLVTDLSLPKASNDAEATVEAIRSGQVDAFVVRNEHVVLLEGAQSPYRAVVERMRQGAVTISPEGDIVYANERFVSMVGTPHGRVLGSRLVDLVRDADRPAFDTLAATKQAAQAELRLRRANGESVDTLATMTPIDGHKMFLFTDMSESKRHQASDERTRRFLGMLAHEFRNILGPINNSVDYLKRSQPLDAEGKAATEVIRRQTDRLLALVEDLRRINPND